MPRWPGRTRTHHTDHTGRSSTCGIFVDRANGPHFWDADGKRYIDYIGSWGPAIVGHAHPEVVRAVQEAAARGLSFGAPTEAEIEMAEEICRLVP